MEIYEVQKDGDFSLILQKKIQKNNSYIIQDELIDCTIEKNTAQSRNWFMSRQLEKTKDEVVFLKSFKEYSYRIQLSEALVYTLYSLQKSYGGNFYTGWSWLMEQFCGKSQYKKGVLLLGNKYYKVELDEQGDLECSSGQRKFLEDIHEMGSDISKAGYWMI